MTMTTAQEDYEAVQQLWQGRVPETLPCPCTVEGGEVCSVCWTGRAGAVLHGAACGYRCDEGEIPNPLYEAFRLGMVDACSPAALAALRQWLEAM